MGSEVGNYDVHITKEKSCWGASRLSQLNLNKDRGHAQPPSTLFLGKKRSSLQEGGKRELLQQKQV